MSTEDRITVNLEKLSSFVNLLLFLLFIFTCVYSYFYPSMWIFIGAGILGLINLVNIYYLYMQKRHTLLANFGVLAQLRYIIESIGPEFRQYLYSSDTEGRPFNRVELAEVYRKSKEKQHASAYGSLLQFNKDEMKFKHSLYPVLKEKVKPYSLVFGKPRSLPSAYTIDIPLMIGGMSYGALGKKAIRALARGAKKAGIAMNTGEGGYPKYHLMESCDLIFQMGTAKFGVRKENGQFDPYKLESLAQETSVKMIEIKFSQGAKPGKGGVLPKEKITQEIAELRGISMGQDVISPPFHEECRDEKSTCYFIKDVQEISKLPVGIKFCFGQEDQFLKLVQTMKSLDIFPDYIALDGAEGGTGAAPKIFMDDVGWPLFESLPFINKVLEDQQVRHKLAIVASGKLISSGKQMMAMSLGADAIYTARGFMLSIGCIQALRCHNNTCPVGITTHSPSLMRGLDIEDKSSRVANYVFHVNKEYYSIMAALGKTSFKDLNSKDLLTYDRYQKFSNPAPVL